MSKGYVKIYRQIFDNPLYFSEPFNRTHAWLDLLLIADHQKSTFFARGIQINIERGEIGYSIKNLSGRWKWSRGKVIRFLEYLKNEKQITYQTTNITTIISICNYDMYQQVGWHTEHQTDTRRTPDGHQTDTKRTHLINDKNEKNDNNVKKKERTLKGPAEKSADPLYKNFVSVYFQFYQDRNQVPPVWKGKEGGIQGAAIKDIIKYLRTAAPATEKNPQAPLDAWSMLLSRFDQWEPFHQKQIKATQILSNLTNIINHIKHGKTKSQALREI